MIHPIRVVCRKCVFAEDNCIHLSNQVEVCDPVHAKQP